MKAVLSIREFVWVMQGVSKEMVDSEPLLTEMDTIIGDGDHGIGIQSGFEAVGEVLAQNHENYKSINDVFYDIGITLIKNMGGASGVIFGTLFIGGILQMPPVQTLDSAFLGEFLFKSQIKIEQRGRAKEGYKTMLDALGPAVRALLKAKGKPLEEALFLAAEAAYLGMEKTKQMLPQIGRARGFAAQALGHADSGAMSTAILFRAMAECTKKMP